MLLNSDKELLERAYLSSPALLIDCNKADPNHLFKYIEYFDDLYVIDIKTTTQLIKCLKNLPKTLTHLGLNKVFITSFPENKQAYKLVQHLANYYAIAISPLKSKPKLSVKDSFLP